MRDRDVVVIGGGPAGATAAATAARAGLDVMLLEAGSHPRPHVGESILPGIIPILRDIGAYEIVAQAGFPTKTGSTHWGWGKTPRWDLWFIDSDAYDHAWFVDRSRFDGLLLAHALALGVDVRQHAAAQSIVWEDDRAVGVRWRPRGGDDEVTHCRFVVDASGPSAMIARDRDLRETIDGLKHQAMWAHFDSARHLPPPRDRQALFVAEANQWWWAFPLDGGRTSVGVVQLDAQGRQTAPRRDFDGELAACSTMGEVLGPAARRSTPVRHERDWSVRMRDVSGPGWFAVGDAAGFIDPVLSTGVMLALHSGWHAARCAAAIAAGDQAEPDGLTHYRSTHREMFGDLLRMVRFYYQQNLYRDDYFWESKRILETRDTELRPQKAFIILTSGLVPNLALTKALQQQEQTVNAGATLDGDEPDHLNFICVHLRHRSEPGVQPSALYLLIERTDPAAPTLFKTANFHLNAIAPRHGNDPISVPAFAGVLEAWRDVVTRLDDQPAETLAEFWRRARSELSRHLDTLPPQFECVRVFGE